MNKKEIPVYQREYKNFKKILLELIYPTTCVLCGKINREGLCEKCKRRNKVIQEPRCMKCGKPIFSQEAEYCNDCITNPKLFKHGKSLWLHKNEVMHSIYKFKYKNYRVYATKYAELLVQAYIESLLQWKPECMVAIPVHKHRRRSRGYNQAEVLASAIQEELRNKVGVEIPIVYDGLYRKKETIFQKKLDNRQRRKNLVGAFNVNEKRTFPKKVLVIDDIYTSGATIQEVSKVLVASGVEEVYFITISIGQGF